MPGSITCEQESILLSRNHLRNMVHIRCDVRKRTEKASDDLSGGSKAVEVEQGVVHAIYAVAAEAAVLIERIRPGNASRSRFSSSISSVAR